MSDIAGVDIVNARLERMLAVGVLPPEAYNEIGNIIKSEMQENFRAGGRPQPWPVSGRVRAFGGQTLRDKGRLMNSLTVVPQNDGVSVTSNVVYARIHALGGIIRAKSEAGLRFRVPLGLQKVGKSGKELKKAKKNYGFARVDQVTIPQRDYRYISSAGVSAIVSAAARRLLVGGNFG